MGRARGHCFQRMMATASQRSCLHVTQTIEFFHLQVCTSLTLYGMGHCQAALPLQYI